MDERLQGLARARRSHYDRWRRRTRMALLFVASLLMINALVGTNGAMEQARLRRDRAGMQAEIARLQAENARLRDEARRLLEDPAAIEAVARRELGMVKPGERVVLQTPAR